jgi:phenylalanyl-tRNA synthetase beta chain
MRVPIEWLHDYVEPHMDAQTLAQRLALTGTEVERVEHHGIPSADNFVVGHVLQREKHPDADRLSVCMVDIGGSTPSQIVCGAPNVAAGLKVAVAKPGAVMPDGTKLRKAKLRGMDSEGMILSERELQISEQHDGIMSLPADLTPGTPLAEVLNVSTDVLVLEITPNRPDCLGIYGVAREVAATTGAQLKPAPWDHDLGSFGALEGLSITVEAGHDLCPRFTARVFDEIKLGESPLWMKARLMAAGQRPISNVVDISNYVMLLTGHPMHAFDYERVAGSRLNVRRAHMDERVETLDGQTRTLDQQMLLIEDADGPTSIAGVMGGARSEVQDTTTSVVSEAATWDGPNIHRTSLKLGLRSEASGRFEKQLQPEQALWAQTVATKLLIEVCGASVRPGTLDIGGPGSDPRTIRLRDARIEGLLGVAIPQDRTRRHLETIGFVTADAPDGLDVTVPDFRRADITREADLIEEVARLDGLENLPATLPASRHAVGALTAPQLRRRRAVDALVARGLHEIVGWSFTGPEMATKLRLIDTGSQVKLANPMSSEQSLLRTTLLGSLLDVAQRNRARGADAIRLFESGAVYRSTPAQGLDADHLPGEPHHLAVLLSGPARPANWRDQNPPQADFFAAKGALTGLFAVLGVEWELHAATEPFLHPGRSAAVLVNGERVGWVGEIHPAVAEEWELSQTVAAFELDLDAIPLQEATIFGAFASFPDVREDLAVIVAETVSAAQIISLIEQAGSPLLAGAEVFDVYRDAERLGEGTVSIAVRLAYRAPDRTLTDAEVAAQRQRIINALEAQLGGRIRTGV